MKEKKKIGWFCSFVPEELIMAAGLEPVRLKGQVKKLTEVDSYVFSNICPYLKNIFDSGLRKKLEQMDGIIFTNSCDGMRKLYDLWIEYIHMPFTFMLEVPKNRDNSALRYFTHQLHALKKSLEEVYGVDISTKLQETISNMNEHRIMLGKIFKQQKDSSPPFKGSELFSLCEDAGTSPKDETLQKLKDLTNQPNPSDKGKTNHTRILIIGNKIDDPALLKLVEDAKGSVVIFDTCNGLKHYSDLVENGPDPIESLARRYLLKPSCQRMPGFDVRMERLEQLIEDYSIKGIIYSHLKYCDYSLFEMPQIEQSLRKREIPFLGIENDYLWTDIERIKIRIEAFIEMIGGEVE